MARSISGLFLRLVLEKNLSVDQILFVTFTEAATDELKHRIRSQLRRAIQAFSNGSDEESFLNDLVKKARDSKVALRHLKEALRAFDQAAIFTIHGFCQRILHENAFETRNSFDTELIVSQASLLMEVVDDFWRKTFYAAPLELVGFTLDKMNGPEYFCRLLERVKTHDVAIVPDLDV